MARARCYMPVYDASGSFEYTFYYVAPSYFLAREPTQQEKTSFVDKIVARYTPRILAMKCFACSVCHRAADQLVGFATYALHDPSALDINYSGIAICSSASCQHLAQEKVDFFKQSFAERHGIESCGPEMLMCGNCHKHGLTQRCGGCHATAYCSRDCQKAHWRNHKRLCTARAEAAKLTPYELLQLDEYASMHTMGTMELNNLNHSGSFPERVEQEGRGTDMIGAGFELAEVRNRAARKQAHRTRKEREARGVTIASPEEVLAPTMGMEGLRLDVMHLFR